LRCSDFLLLLSNVSAYRSLDCHRSLGRLVRSGGEPPSTGFVQVISSARMIQVFGTNISFIRTIRTAHVCYFDQLLCANHMMAGSECRAFNLASAVRHTNTALSITVFRRRLIHKDCSCCSISLHNTTLATVGERAFGRCNAASGTGFAEVGGNLVSSVDLASLPDLTASGARLSRDRTSFGLTYISIICRRG
jgi:hypothetical protein